jgi:quercetin dioxygenase-like cupin family protein
MLTGLHEKYEEAAVTKVAESIERRIIHTGNLMLVVVDFYNGPTNSPDPFHHHTHEQVSYMAKGEVLLFSEGKEPVHLKMGDVFAMPSNVPHTIQRLSAHVRIVDCFTPLRQEFLHI